MFERRSERCAKHEHRACVRIHVDFYECTLEPEANIYSRSFSSLFRFDHDYLHINQRFKVLASFKIHVNHWHLYIVCKSAFFYNTKHFYTQCLQIAKNNSPESETELNNLLNYVQ